MPGGVIGTGSHPKLLWPGLRATWGQVYGEHMEEYVDLYDVEDSEQAYEEYVQITPFGLAPVKAEGAPVQFDSEVQGPVGRFTHVAYALGFIVTHEEFKDNLYEIVSTRRARANAYSMRQTIETTAAFLYNNGFVTTYYTTPDGLAVFSNAHTNTTGGTYSNILSPAADLSEASIEDLTIQIMGALNDRGGLINIMPISLHVARQEWYNANRILKSVLQPDTALNNLNVLKATNVFPKGIKMNHYFTAPHAWFIRTNAPEGAKFMWRERPDFFDDNDFDTRNLKHFGYMRFAVGVNEPRSVYGSNGP